MKKLVKEHLNENQDNSVKTISISAKVRDMFYAVLRDANGNEIKEVDGYVPDWMPGEHYGDYIELDIDVQTGQILNWETPSQEDFFE